MASASVKSISICIPSPTVYSPPVDQLPNGTFHEQPRSRRRRDVEDGPTEEFDRLMISRNSSEEVSEQDGPDPHKTAVNLLVRRLELNQELSEELMDRSLPISNTDINEQKQILLEPITLWASGDQLTLGTNLITVKDQVNIAHYFVSHPQGAAKELSLCHLDELLALNDQRIVGQSNSKVKEMLKHNIPIDEEFCLVLRRVSETDANKYDYIKLTAKLFKEKVSDCHVTVDENQNDYAVCASAIPDEQDCLDGKLVERIMVLKAKLYKKSYAMITIFYKGDWEACRIRPAAVGDNVCYYHKGELRIAPRVEEYLAQFTISTYLLPVTGPGSNFVCYQILYSEPGKKKQCLKVGKSYKELMFQKTSSRASRPDDDAVFLCYNTGTNNVALESLTHRGYYLCHRSQRVLLDKMDGAISEREDLQFQVLNTKQNSTERRGNEI